VKVPPPVLLVILPMLTAAKPEDARAKTSVAVLAKLQASCSMRIYSPMLDEV
jgi:hypothetical protein